MIDFHNHTIPSLDDGPKNIETAVEMCKCAFDQGITDIINTVHFQHPKMENKNTSYKHVVSEVEKFNKILLEQNININIHAASEVYYLPNLTEILDNPITTFGNKKYMLIEFETMFLPKNYKDEFFRLMLKGVTPVIAHPERYRFVQSNLSLVKDWVDLGYVIQLDCGSIIGDFGLKVQETSHFIIKNSLCHLIGSDAHNNKKRNFCLKETYEYLENFFSLDFVNGLKKNSINIFNGMEINNINYKFNNKKKLLKFFRNLIK